MRRSDRSAGRRLSHRGWAVGLAILLLLPVILGALLGWYFINPPQSERLSPPGSEAHGFLDGLPDTRLVVEIAYQASAPPPAGSALATLGERINETCTKSSVSWLVHGFTSQQSSFSMADIEALATSQRQIWPGPGTMSLFYLYLDGGYAADGSVLGMAFWGSSIAIFAGTIAQNAPGGGIAAVTATVLVHEFGHELGLVGIIGNAPNEDPAHPYHSSDPNDVMYWSVDTTAAFLGVLGGPSPPTEFDAADRADLASVRGSLIPLEILPWIVLMGTLAAGIALAVLRVRGRRTGVSPSPTPEPAAPTK